MNQSYPAIKVDLGRGCACGNVDSLLKGMDGYIGKSDSLPSILSAVIPLDHYNSLESYRVECKKRYKGAILRNMAKAEPFFCMPFEWSNYIPDVVEINHSKEVRCGGKMRASYLRSVEEMGGAPKELKPVKSPSCNQHWRITLGIFKGIPNYKQGKATTHLKLIGYVSMVRIKDLALYAMILGHGDYLKYGIMYKLHFYIVGLIRDGEWLKKFFDDLMLDGELIKFFDGIKVLMYAAWESGGKGLQLWKKKTLFEPAYLVEV